MYYPCCPFSCFELCFRLLGVANTALLAISTPDSIFNYYSELMNLPGADGQQLFRTIRIGLTCEECEKSGLLCNHKLSLLPHWKPAELQAKVDAILATNPELAMQETRGTFCSGNTMLIKEKWIEHMVKAPVYIINYAIPFLYTYVDPSGGGKSSDYCLTTLAYVNGHTVVSKGRQAKTQWAFVLHMHIETILYRVGTCDW
jgi:hypothetical protein